MHKLIFRAFPFHFVNNSIMAHFPFVVPAENKIIHDALGTSELYSVSDSQPALFGTFDHCNGRY